jgi:hypothetical protein
VAVPLHAAQHNVSINPGLQFGSGVPAITASEAYSTPSDKKAIHEHPALIPEMARPANVSGCPLKRR